MADTEEYFPRGGKKPAKAFKQSSNFLGSVESHEKKQRKPKKKLAEGDDGYLSEEGDNEYEQSIRYCAVGLSYKTVKPGLLILGRILKILETKLSISLPCNLVGLVNACHVSEAYNKLLEAYVEDRIESVRPLKSMFRVGQYVTVKVLEVNDSGLMVSMMPQHVNEGRMHSDLHRGALLQAAVSSVEDHGYVMDIGIPNTRAFLPKKYANQDIELDEGVLTWCCVKSVTPSPDNSIVTVTNQLMKLRDGLAKRDNGRGVAALLPGTAVEFVVDKALENGIEGRIFNETVSYIQRAHTDPNKAKKPKLGQKIRARLLYDMPTRKTPFFTTRNIFEETYPDLEKEQIYGEGDIVEEAQVIKLSKRSVVFNLGKKCIGNMTLNFKEHDDLTDEQVLAKSYPLGSKHKVRILKYLMSDYRYLVSDSSEVISEKYFSLADLRVGELVTGTVLSVTEAIVKLQVGRVHGLVTQAHMFDSGLYSDSKKANKIKNPAKKFKIGHEVQARVLYLDQESNHLQLTLKPSLLAPDVEALHSYEDAQIGKAYKGVIMAVRDYVIVSFFNNVAAYVPRAYVTTQDIPDLEDAFHQGQIVDCTIIKVFPENKKMQGSLTTAPFIPDDRNLKKAEKRKANTKPAEVPNKKSRESDNSDTEKTQVSKKKNDKKSKKETTNETKKKKDKKQKATEQKSSEESDAIETDIAEEPQILRPQEQYLIDLTTCQTRKNYKKRVVSILKAIKARTRKIDDIDKKIATLTDKEEKQTTQKNKRLNSQKFIEQERIQHLMEALTKAQEKLKEFPEEEKIDFKNKNKIERVIENATINKAEKNDDVDKMIKEKAKVIKVVQKMEEGIEIPSAKEFWTEDLGLGANKREREDSSSEEEEQTEQRKKKRKKLTAAEKVAKAREEEERLRELERAAIEGAGSPQSVDQFERALLANPDSSQLWIAYMAFHLQCTEIEKARGVGRKALSTISFREEQEKLNVWLAIINFENRFGTTESQQKVLEDALQMNDPYKVHSKLLDIYVDTSKVAELTALVDLMMKKYKRDPQTYVSCGSACYKLGLTDKARYVMQKAVSILDKKEHIAVLVQFALLERDSGDRERSEALFEQILSANPQRVDVCSTYVDMLYKVNEVDRIRQVMERMTSLKLPARKMKVLFKKWIELEEKIGDEEQIENIRNKAMKYIESAKTDLNHST